ncbi:Uncharacterised protein [Cedecea neteri]|uniref:Uncharacterized protein n=1 Tax=Cedecea neteri TaxID=158822 RepID=A0A2X2SUP0_9ENTR|nr:Uncharacterised protein [Cedecea neteri]
MAITGVDFAVAAAEGNQAAPAQDNVKVTAGLLHRARRHVNAAVGRLHQIARAIARAFNLLCLSAFQIAAESLGIHVRQVVGVDLLLGQAAVCAADGGVD